MEATKYELAYACAQYAINATRNVDAVVRILCNASAPMTCKEIGTAMWGDDYKRFPEKEVGTWPHVDRRKDDHNQRARELTADLGHILGNLLDANLINVIKEKGEPFTIEEERFVNVVDGEICESTIEVWDAKGNKYEMQNPNYRRGHGEYRKVPVTITPTVKRYYLA